MKMNREDLIQKEGKTFRRKWMDNISYVDEELSKEESENLLKFGASEEFWKENHKEACKFREKKRKEFLDGRLPQDQEFIIKAIHGFDKKEGRCRRKFLHKEEPLALDAELKLTTENKK